MIESIPLLGVGLGYRHHLASEMFEARAEIDFLEVITDDYVRTPARLGELEALSSHFQVIPHGVGLSLGSVAPLSKTYLRAMREIADLLRAPYYSEHLCVCTVPGIDIGHLSPLWYTEEVLAHTIDNVNMVQDLLGCPLVLENITVLFDIPHGTLHQTEFFQRLVTATGCGVLLDVTNVFINAVNLGFDPEAFLREMPLDRVIQAHLAGGYWSQGILIDGHSEPVQEESWRLFAQLVAQAPLLKGTILEHDANFPPLDALLDQLARARTIVAAAPRA